jgi:peptidoglycan hydrolase-like protein with peptidoglycan-binding domain
MTNSYVTTLQMYLKSLGYYNLRVDGIFGVGTETGVRNFQIMNGLPATGVADDATQRLLYSGTALGSGGGGGGGGGSSGYATLRIGNRGTAVRNMQVRLANLGYYTGPIDGIFGSKTEAAVRSFQSRNNLAVSGIAYSETQSALYSSSALPNGNASSGYVYLHYGSRGAAVTRLQTALKNLGYYKGPLSGQYYDQTYAAVKAFQRANGLVADGIAGRKTQNRLYGTNY